MMSTLMPIEILFSGGQMLDQMSETTCATRLKPTRLKSARNHYRFSYKF